MTKNQAVCRNATDIPNLIDAILVAGDGGMRCNSKVDSQIEKYEFSKDKRLICYKDIEHVLINMEDLEGDPIGYENHSCFKGGGRTIDGDYLNIIFVIYVEEKQLKIINIWLS